MLSRFEKEFPVYQQLVSHLPAGFPDKNSYTSDDNVILQHTITRMVYYRKLDNGSLEVSFLSRGKHPLTRGGFVYFETDAQTAEQYIKTEKMGYELIKPHWYRISF
jgi:hypothetical protein